MELVEGVAQEGEAEPAPPPGPADAELLPLEEGPQTSVWAITGGTGKYKEAGGQVKSVDVSETETRLTFKITD